MPEISTLKSGLRVITDEMPHIRSASVGVWVNVGARHEAQDEHGIAHLLEHMAFKGTSTRSALEIAEQIENVGGTMNAYTGRDQTGYYMRVLSQDVELVVSILGDILRDSAFDETELGREKGVVIQEIGECEDNPDDVLFDNLADLCYPDHNLGKTILGTRESVMNISRDQLINYVKRFYHPSNMIFAASGDVNHQKMLEFAEKYMTFMPGTIKPELSHAKWSGGVRSVHKELEQIHMAFALPAISCVDKRFFVSEVLSMIYGGGMSSRLFQEIREKRGLVYSISSFSSYLQDCGKFGLYAGTSADKYLEVLEISLQEFIKLSEYISDAELERAKAQLRSGAIMTLEKPSGRVEAAVRQQFIFNRFFSPDELIEQVNAVSSQDVYDYAQFLLSTKTPSFVSLGTVSSSEAAQKILSQYFPV